MANKRKELNVKKYIQWVRKLLLTIWSIFIRLAVAASQICEMSRNSERIRT